MNCTRSHWLTPFVLLLSLLVSCVSVAGKSATGIVLAQGASLSEDEDVAERLEGALEDFLDSLQGEGVPVGPEQLQRFGFFYGSLGRGSVGTESQVLKSYPVGDGVHMVTVAFLSGLPDQIAVSRIVELEAMPVGDGFRFRCAYGRNTARMHRHQIGEVTFRFAGVLDRQRAEDFVRVKSRLEGLRGRQPQPLQYDCFSSLQELLRAFGLVHDASKCNFLERDLGFLWHDGQRYATGTGDENYLFGYVRGLLAETSGDRDAIFRPYLNGAAAYYGGYGLSGDSMEDLARQFRGELQRRPAINFLEEFHKGRKSSVHRHFSHYVMCAFFFQEMVTCHGEAEALRLVESGADGAGFFEQLERHLGVTDANFHATIVRLIGA